MDLPFELDKPYEFYGVDNECFKLGDQVFEVLEDAGDGYRSYLASVEVANKEGLIFFKTPIATVKVVEANEGAFEGYSVISTIDGHEWLRFGTDEYNDYYPSFVFRYSPRAP